MKAVDGPDPSARHECELHRPDLAIPLMLMEELHVASKKPHLLMSWCMGQPILQTRNAVGHRSVPPAVCY